LDIATIGGFFFAVMMIAFGAYFEHITIDSLLGLSAFLIVIGGSTGATILSHSMAELKMVPTVVKMAVFPRKLDYGGMIDYLVGLADKARRNGLLSLQEDAEVATHPLVKRGLTMAVDGVDPEHVLDTLEAMSEMDSAAKNSAGAVFDTCGGYSPTLGIMGTVMGLVTVMRDLSTPDKLGPAIAVAFLATLYGVGFANLLFLPLGAKIKAAVRQETKFNSMIIEGIIGLQSGENPRNLREKLSIYATAPSGRKARGEVAQTAREGV
jgi:chemotaxis protein MotA